MLIGVQLPDTKSHKKRAKMFKITGGLMKAKPPETLKYPKFKRNKQLISLILKQNMYTYYDQPMLSCYLHENSIDIIRARVFDIIRARDYYLVF